MQNRLAREVFPARRELCDLRSVCVCSNAAHLEAESAPDLLDRLQVRNQEVNDVECVIQEGLLRASVPSLNHPLLSAVLGCTLSMEPRPD